MPTLIIGTCGESDVVFRSGGAFALSVLLGPNNVEVLLAKLLKHDECFLGHVFDVIDDGPHGLDVDCGYPELEGCCFGYLKWGGSGDVEELMEDYVLPVAVRVFLYLLRDFWVRFSYIEVC